MLYREIIAVCSEIHTKQIVCWQNVELLNVKLAVHIVTILCERLKQLCCSLTMHGVASA